MTGKPPARVGITDWVGAQKSVDWKRNTKLLPAYYHHHLPQADVSLAEAFHEAGDLPGL